MDFDRQASLDLAPHAAMKGAHKLHHKVESVSAIGYNERGSTTTASSFLSSVCWLLLGCGLSQSHKYSKRQSLWLLLKCSFHVMTMMRIIILLIIKNDPHVAEKS